MFRVLVMRKHGSTPGASTAFSQSSQDDENRCSTAAVSNDDAVAQALETARTRWTLTRDTRWLRRVLLDVLRGLEKEQD